MDDTYLGGKAPVAHGALEGPFFGVASVVDLQGRVAGEGLEAEVTGSVSSSCEMDYS